VPPVETPVALRAPSVSTGVLFVFRLIALLFFIVFLLYALH
jgi:hypothetical protein